MPDGSLPEGLVERCVEAAKRWTTPMNDAEWGDTVRAVLAVAAPPYAAEPVNAVCRETWRRDVQGVCPIHGGDACLVAPSGLVAELARVTAENARLRKGLRSVVLDCEVCGWECSVCGTDPVMRDTDLYASARAALGGTEGT